MGSGADSPDGWRATTTAGGTVFTALGWRALAFNVAFWTLFGALQASNSLLLPLGNDFPHPWRLIASAMLGAYMWALFTPAIFRLAAHVAPDQRIRLSRIAQVLLIGLVVSALAAAVASTVNTLLVPRPGAVAGVRQERRETGRVAGAVAPDAPRLPGAGPAPGRAPSVASSTARSWRLPRVMRVLRTLVRTLRHWYFQELVTFFGVFAAGLVSDLSRRYRAREREAAQLQGQTSQLQAEQAELRARAARLQAQSAELNAQLAEARLAMLRTRLNPHFLFNTLNAVSALVAKNPKGVRDMIALLSELLRHALAETRAQEIPLREEARLLQLYLEILEIRYQGLLRTVMTIDPGVQEALVPNLILQPLVENAMKHGVDRAGGRGAIEVRADRVGDELVLTVRDTGPVDGPVPTSGSSGIGLRLTRERLVELYGTEQRLELTPSPGGGMTARVVLPYHTSGDVRLAEEVAQP
jgi:two-component sensor histidine kinase